MKEALSIASGFAEMWNYIETEGNLEANFG
jgi:hypothetical protein